MNDTHITFYTPYSKENNVTLETVLNKILFCPPLFPVKFNEVSAKWKFNFFNIGDEIKILKHKITISTIELNHPGGSTGYKLQYKDHSVCYITDHAHDEQVFDEHALLKFVKKTDLLIFDCMFTKQDLKKHKNWGHSSWEEATGVARKAEVEKLILFHVHPDYTDKNLKKIEKQAQEKFSNTTQAKERTKIEIRTLTKITS